MEISKWVPNWIQSLPRWAVLLSILLGMLVVMTVVSTILRLFFAVVAAGVELGSVTAGVIAGLSMLLLMFIPIVLLVRPLLNNKQKTDTTGDKESNSIQRLRKQYVNGDISEEIFETRLEQLLDEPGEGTDDDNTATERTRSIQETETTN
ncbi:SHOCT domain-containing protein [Halalkalicoccus jeotgali]|uniref:SHOCT domain-containing protein n=1 Tax=Halalkalicoccus jeotgali (strain DSM 18796 / CECT 7217 / JCM 14584 / KCTC 4019 / B3) TaxID=795797 RepID=D8JC97_HALJB|nr:SHOCT domain-containing protein [Halalkalicoccus jeotgali]ADJ17004.1 hypothetical protein HacjB3_18308 [Halalkalicoccus jeotgali B3]ELY38834.1 hypothetical protein C497_06614 [Halalkalicoccus jeotgali B3]